MLTRVLSCFADAVSAVRWWMCLCCCDFDFFFLFIRVFPSTAKSGRARAEREREKTHWIKLFIAHIFVVGAGNINNTCIISMLRRRSKKNRFEHEISYDEASGSSSRRRKNPPLPTPARTALQYNIWRIYGTLIVSGDLLMRLCCVLRVACSFISIDRLSATKRKTMS